MKKYERVYKHRIDNRSTKVYIYGSPSWEANSHSISQIPRLLWNPKVRYHIHNSPPLVPIMSQMHPVHTFPTYFPKICSNIIPSDFREVSSLQVEYMYPDAVSAHFVCCLVIANDNELLQKRIGCCKANHITVSHCIE
jgi:hypothetical protein